MKKAKHFLQNHWPKIKAYAIAHKPTTIIGVMVFFSVVYMIFGHTTTTSASQYVFGRVQLGDITETISGTGQVTTLSQVDIKPQTVGQAQTLGQIISVSVQNGDFVKAGQVIAILDGKNALQTFNQAKASVESAQANYDNLVNPSDQDLASVQNSISNTQTTIANDKENTMLDLRSDLYSVENSVYTNTDPFFADPTDPSPSLSVSGVTFSNQNIINALSAERPVIAVLLSDWRNELDSISSSSDITTLINDALGRLNTIRTYFDNMTQLFARYAVAADSSSQSTLNSDKSTAASARSSIDSIIGDLTSSLQSYQSSLTLLAQEQQSLSFKTSPSESDVTTAKSQLDNAEANYQNALTNYQSRIITAPFDGQIGGLNAQVGQQVSSNDSLGTIITPQKVVNVTLSEVDVSKVAAGASVALTFDALPDTTLSGHVVYIDPLGVSSQGVVNYNVRISIDDQNNQVKTGMTATADIVVNSATSTLVVPLSAIKTQGSRKYVLVAVLSTSSEQAMSQGFGGRFASTSSTTRARGFRNASSTNPFASSTFSTSTFSSSTARARFASSSRGTTAASATDYPVQEVDVTTGIENDTQVQILSGLSEGQLIVTRTIAASAAAKTTAPAASASASRTGGNSGVIRIGGSGGGLFGR
jgi:HlyD family secretion protein